VIPDLPLDQALAGLLLCALVASVLLLCLTCGAKPTSPLALRVRRLPNALDER
jgi:hypothetical protein